MFDPNCFEEVSGKQNFLASCVVAVVLAIMILGFIGLVIYEDSKNANNRAKENIEKMSD